MATLNNIERILQQRLQAALTRLPTVLGNEGVNWIKDNFRKRQGWPGNGFEAWKPRKANARRNAGRGILIDSGRLSRSPRIISTAPLLVNIGTDVPYAKAHNEGVDKVVSIGAHTRAKIGTVKLSTGQTGKYRKKRTITGTTQVKAHQRRMRLPKRQFAGNSPVLQSILTRKAVLEVAKELNK